MISSKALSVCPYYCSTWYDWLSCTLQIDWRKKPSTNQEEVTSNQLACSDKQTPMIQISLRLLFESFLLCSTKN